MEINIFDVAHGFCTYIVADNGNVILIDCGHNNETGFRPSNYLPTVRCSGIEWFIVSNYDEDHLSDLPQLKQRLPIQMLSRNRTITVGQLARLKRRANAIIGPGITSLLDMMDTYTHDVENRPEFPRTELGFFLNNYPDFQDTNNISLVTFLHYNDIYIVFPGDLERDGWLALLSKPSFCEHLRKINFFVASHHGRVSGYCEKVFDYCEPELVIISDEHVQYDTQEVDYSRHASGVSFGGHRRYVLTTRKDGMITIWQHPGERSYVSYSR